MGDYPLASDDLGRGLDEPVTAKKILHKVHEAEVFKY